MTNSPADPATNVGIVTRTRNNPLLLWRAMESVLGQTHANWTHIVINDGGEKEPVDRLANRYRDQYGQRLIVQHQDQPLGPEASFNQSVRVFNGRYIAVHDDDDSWDGAFLEKAIAALQLQQGFIPATRGLMTWCTCVHEHIEGERIVEESAYSYNDSVKNVRLHEVLARNFIPAICFLFERSVLDDLGGFDESLTQLGFREFLLRFVARYEIGVLEKHLAYYRQCPGPSPEYRQTLFPPFNHYAANETRFRNELLRRDLANGKFGLGSLMALMANSESLATQQQQQGDRLQTLCHAETRKQTRFCALIDKTLSFLSRGSKT